MVIGDTLLHVSYNPPRMRFWSVFGIVALLCSWSSSAQSLGDVARQERARKSQSRQVAQHVYTNEDISRRQTIPSESFEEHSNDARLQTNQQDSQSMPSKELQARIRTQKQRAHELETRIREIQRRLAERSSIGSVTASQSAIALGKRGVGPCELNDAAYTKPYQEWCQEPAKLTAELEKKTAELKEVSKVLGDLQERARRMGYGSAFYDPD